MAAVYKVVTNLGVQLRNFRCKTLIHSQKAIPKRLFHTMLPLRLREVHEKTKDQATTIEGQTVTSPRTKNLLKLDGPTDSCPLCKLNMDIKYTDILIISQFVQEDGNIIPKSVTGLCLEQHRRMKELIRQAHRAGLMQSLRPDVFPAEYDHMSDFAWKKYNVYFTEALDDY